MEIGTPKPRSPRGEPRPFPIRDKAGKVQRWAIDVMAPGKVRRWGINVELPVENGKRRRRRLYGETPRECQAKAAEFRRLMAGEFAPLPPQTPLDKFLEIWLEQSKPTLQPQTRTRYRGIIRRLLSPELGFYPVNRLETSGIEQAVRQWVSAGTPALTVRQALGLLRQVLELAVEWRLVETNVADAVTPPAVSKPVQSPAVAPAPEQVEIGEIGEIAPLPKPRPRGRPTRRVTGMSDVQRQQIIAKTKELRRTGHQWPAAAAQVGVPERTLRRWIDWDEEEHAR